MTQTNPHLPTSRNRLLAALTPADSGRLRPDLRPVELGFGERLFDAGSRIDAVFFVESGMVSLLADAGNGEQVEVGLCGREGLVGRSLVLGDDRSPVTSRVQLGGAALRIGAAEFRAAMQASDTMRGLLLRYALAFHAQVECTPSNRTPGRGGRLFSDELTG